MPGPGVYNIHTVIGKDIHSFKRKVISQGLTDRCMREFEPSLNVHIDKFIQNLGELSRETCPAGPQSWSTPINMTQWCQWLAYDVMGQFGFGQSFEMQDKPDNHFLIRGIAASNRRANIYAQFPDLKKTRIDTLLYPWASQMRQRFLSLTTRIVQDRLRAEVYS